jgi:hypothetical protein
MKLTADEYRRGWLRWNRMSGTVVRTATTNSPDALAHWSTPLADASGSKVQSEPGQFRQLRFEPGPIILPPGVDRSPFPAMWECIEDNEVVQTAIYDRFDSPVQFSLVHIPSYGTFHRLVIAATPTLSWETDAILAVGEVIVRLITGKFTGERVSPLDQVEVDGADVSVKSDWSGTAEAEGRFVEIVAPGDDQAAAGLHASAVLGLLALVFGASVVGEVIISEPYAVALEEPQRGQYRIPITMKLPQAVEDLGLDVVDHLLVDFLDGDRLKEAIRFALHWSKRGIRSRTPLDEL